MSRNEFMMQLEWLLEDVAEEEKKEALSYYRSYFEDAGVENEVRILKELESPEKVAATIKADLGWGRLHRQGNIQSEDLKTTGLSRKIRWISAKAQKGSNPRAKPLGGGIQNQRWILAIQRRGNIILDTVHLIAGMGVPPIAAGLQRGSF